MLAIVLGGVALLIVLALFRPTRVLATYLISMAACSAALALALAALVFFGSWMVYPDASRVGNGEGLMIGLGAVVAGVIGALAGIPVGAAAAYRLTRRASSVRTRPGF